MESKLDFRKCEFLISVFYILIEDIPVRSKSHNKIKWFIPSEHNNI